jgi:hypothetical protein
VGFNKRAEIGRRNLFLASVREKDLFLKAVFFPPSTWWSTLFWLICYGDAA